MEAAGEVGALAGEAKRHLASCQECSQAAAEELQLRAAIRAATPAEDHELQTQIMVAVSQRRLRRRLFAVLPIAASFLVAVIGGLMIGGLPGRGLVSLLPLWSGHGWLAFADVVRDWSLVLLTTARMAGDLIPPLVQVAAALLALAGLWTSAVALSRVRETIRWPSKA
jgi:anti-sigma factor RsiW